MDQSVLPIPPPETTAAEPTVTVSAWVSVVGPPEVVVALSVRVEVVLSNRKIGT